MIVIGMVDVKSDYDLSPRYSGGSDDLKTRTCLVLDLISEVVSVKQLHEWQLYGYTGFIYDKNINRNGKIMVCVHFSELDHKSTMEWLNNHLDQFDFIAELPGDKVQKEYYWNRICNDFLTNIKTFPEEEKEENK